MIQREEIDTKAKEFQISPINVERDYVFGWLLVAIYKTSQLGSILILKGGNCFRKAYFASTRFSNDLDFSTQSPIDDELLRREFGVVCDFIESQAGVRFEAERLRVELEREIDAKRRVFGIRLYFKDFYGKPDKFTISVSLDIVEFDRILLPVQSRQLIHPYSDVKLCATELRCVKLEEMLGNKLKCLLQRRHIVDLYDLAYSVLVNRDIEVDRREVVSTFLQKTIFQPSPGVAKSLLLELPFHTMKEAWTRYVICPIQGAMEWDGALDGLRQFVDALFSPFPTAGYGALAYFPATVRNAVMEAGAKRRILRLTYDGVPRLVEPYSLVYKRRQDGHAQEYLYVFDRTGGMSSGPGVKSLVHSKISKIEETEEVFEPRFPVELAKAGEYSDKTYFGSPFGRVSFGGVSRVRRAQGSRVVYTYQCTYCNRKFSRTTRTSRLRPHKDAYGNNCHGRSAVLVNQQHR
jgi:predicted nucleotidyltransferase component of viral defense system